MDVLKLNGYSDIFKRPIFVTGLPYGGGNKAAKLIKEMGVWTGRTAQGPRSNPIDSLENQRLRERLIKPTLKQMGCDPDGVQTLPNPKQRVNLVFPTKEGNIDLQEKLHRMLEVQEYDHARCWMYYDTRLALLWRSFLSSFPDAQWVIVRQKEQAYVKSCLENPQALEISQKARFWAHLSNVYTARFDLLCARGKHVHEIQLQNIEEGNLSELKLLSDKIGIQFSPKRSGRALDPKRWKHS